MDISLASIIIRNKKSFLPVHGLTDSGLFIDIEPVFICDLSIEKMTDNLQQVREIGHPHFKELSREEWKKRTDPVLKATCTKSWKELVRSGFSYTLEWSNKGVLIEMSRLDKQGRWEYDPLKTKRLPIDTPYNDLIQVILDDYHSRLFINHSQLKTLTKKGKNNKIE